MAKQSRRKDRQKRYTHTKPGSSPGLVLIDEQALKSVITLHTYHTGFYKKEEIENLNSVVDSFSNQEFNYWVDVKGLGDIKIFEVLSKHFNVNRLVLEDITRPHQRPKLEEYDNDNFVFAISRMLYLNDDNGLENEQVSYILTKNVLFTFQENYQDCFDPVRKRMEIGKGNIRLLGSSYLMYAIMDVIIDNYFTLLNVWGEELDAIEDRLYERPDKRVMYDIQTIKRSLISIRRVSWPERDKLNDILRTESKLISEQTRMYFRDAYDHCFQIIDLVESMKEISANNIDMYLSIISNRMNEIMKVLTIISSIFIPLTFIAGIYGMNFSREDPVTGKVLSQNMPELYYEHGYTYTLAVMVVIAVLQIIYFWRKGWFR